MGMKNGRRSTSAIVACLLFLSPLLAYLAIVYDGGNTFLFEDGLLYSFPMRVFLHDAFAGGFSPQWVPYCACGFSVLAEGQSAVCFPATQILYRLFSAESAWLIEMISGHLLAFLCSCGLLRHLGVSTLACLFGASVYTFCAAALYTPMVPSMMWCYALLPVLFWVTARFMEGGERASLALLTVVTLVLLTGHPVMMLYFAMVLFAFVVSLVVKLASEEAPLRHAGARVLFGLVVVSLAVLLASPQLLPILQQFSFSARTTAGGGSLEALQNTLHMKPSWIGLSLLPTPFDSMDSVAYWSVGVRFPIYALFLAMVALVPGGKAKHRWYFAGLAVFVILMAMGPRVGLWKLIHSLPLLRHFRFPVRWLFFLPLSVSVLSALGLDRLNKEIGGVPTASLRWIPRLLLLCMLAAGLGMLLRRQGLFVPGALAAFRSRPCLSGTLWLSSGGMVVAAMLTSGRAFGKRPVSLGVGLAVVSLCLTRVFCLYDPGVVRHLETIGWPRDPLPGAPQLYRTSSGLDTYTVWTSGTIDKHYRYTPNVSLLEGRLNTGYYCSFVPYWASDVSSWCQETLSGAESHERILDLCSARWLVSPETDESGMAGAEVQAQAVARERENPRAIPRASIVRSFAFCANDREQASLLESATFDSRRTALLLAQDRELFDPTQDTSAGAGSAPAPTANILVDKPDHIEIEIVPGAPRGSLLVLSDTYFPGWKASVDDVREEILRVNYAFRGVRLPEGAKRVAFTFEPLVPDAILPLPTIILGVLGLTLAVRFPRRDSLLA